MKIVFFGNSSVSADFLGHIFFLSDGGLPGISLEVSAVITALPKPAGRGLKLKETPVKTIALKSGVPLIFETEDLKGDKTLSSKLMALSSDLGVVVSYGRIIPREIFSIPKFGCINVHFSLLPHLRGAAPIQWSLIRGERKTGASVFFINEELDGGDMLVQKEVGIEDEDDFFTLRDKLALVGKSALEEALLLIAHGKAPQLLRSQKELARYYEPSYAPAIKKSDGKIDWSKSAAEIRNLVRGILEWPVAYTFLPDGRMIKIFKTSVVKSCPGLECAPRPQSGEVVSISKGEGFLVACGEDFLKIAEVQPANSKRMLAQDFVSGGGIKVGYRLS